MVRGQQFSVSGRIATVTGDEVAKLGDGVPASFTLEVVDPSGQVLATQDVTAGSLGSFDTTVPGSVTAKLPRTSDATVLAVRAVDASYADYAADDAGAGAVTVAAAATGLQIQNSFVSSVGWVKPGEKYPSRIILTNPADKPAADVKVTVGAPRGTSFIGARAASGTVSRSADLVTWTVKSVPAAKDGQPGTATLILEHQADTLERGAHPGVARPQHEGQAGGRFRQPDRAQPRAQGHPAGRAVRHRAVRRPAVPGRAGRLHGPQAPGGSHRRDARRRRSTPPTSSGSTFNLYQEMSLGQLFPNGTVPSAGIATADFTYEPGFPFTQLEPQGPATA